MAIVAQPFVKWAGGKRHLLSQLETLLPDNFDELEDVTYVEPFVGGGAVLFHMLNNHPNIRRAIINDINPNLIECYRLVKEHPNELISELQKIQDLYNSADIEGKERIYYDYRSKYNNDELTTVKKAAIFIFLNHTCFNGLYRVNANGAFNVPFGKYMKPMICNAELILEDSRLLNSVDLVIMNGDYRGVGRRLARRNTNFVYFDPPYRPISVTSSFHTYSNIPFGDEQQVELRDFCNHLDRRDCFLMLSNSDSRNDDGTSYFEELYVGYNFQRIYAHRFINATSDKRVKLTEVLVRNY